MSALVEGARQLGIELSPAQIAQFDQYEAALRDWNNRMNLMSASALANVEVQHFLDSLTAAVPLLPRLRDGASLRLADVGAGGGFPGIPLKIAFPATRLTLIEATRKKAEFLRYAVEGLGLEEVEVVPERAESAGRDERYRDSFQWATARAVGPLPVVLELCAPFLEVGGLLVAQRRGDLEAETLAAAPAFKALKLWARAPIPVTLPALADGRGLIVAEKNAPTPARFPRRPGIPKKEPLA